MELILITGAHGFIGRAVTGALAARGKSLRRAVRTSMGDDDRTQVFETGNLDAFENWPALLNSVGCVVHLANVAHVDDAELTRAQRENVDGTVRLGEAAAVAGVRRFVYVSSAKVYGDETKDRAFSALDPPAPHDGYARVKLEAEARLREIGMCANLELVVVRPPLVYGPGVKANFLALMRAVERGWPLPLASVKNRRSLLYVENLADAIVRCVELPQAAGRTYLLSDGAPVSTPQLCRALGAALGRPARLFPFSVSLLELAPPLRKLTRSFEVDDSAIRRELGWSPPYSFEEGIRATAEWYLKEQRRLRG